MSLPDQSMLKLGVPQATPNSRTNIVDKGMLQRPERRLQKYKGIKGTGYKKEEGERTGQSKAGGG